MYNGITYNIYERLLGLSLTSWSERLNEARLKNKAAAVTFVRRVPPELSSDALTFQPGKGLSVRGGPDLQPWRPYQFRVKEFPDVVFTFTVESGKVLAMRQRDPSGEYVFPRAP